MPFKHSIVSVDLLRLQENNFFPFEYTEKAASAAFLLSVIVRSDNKFILAFFWQRNDVENMYSLPWFVRRTSYKVLATIKNATTPKSELHTKQTEISFLCIWVTPRIDVPAHTIPQYPPIGKRDPVASGTYTNAFAPFRYRFPGLATPLSPIHEAVSSSMLPVHKFQSPASHFCPLRCYLNWISKWNIETHLNPIVYAL